MCREKIIDTKLKPMLVELTKRKNYYGPASILFKTDKKAIVF